MLKIVKTKDPSAIKYIAPLVIDSIKRDEITDYDMKAFVMWLRANISNPTIGTWVALKEEEDKPLEAIGFAVAIVQQNLMREFVNISQLFGDSETEQLLFDAILKWTQEEACVYMVLITSKHPKKWKDEFGFEVVNHVLSKEV
jgi:hypothetical protein